MHYLPATNPRQSLTTRKYIGKYTGMSHAQELFDFLSSPLPSSSELSGVAEPSPSLLESSDLSSSLGESDFFSSV